MSASLKQAPIGVRKAAALYGVHQGKYETVYESISGPKQKVAKIYPQIGKWFYVTQEDVDMAELKDWKDIL